MSGLGSGSGMKERSGMGNYTEPDEPDSGGDEFTYESEKTAKMVMIGLYAISFLFSLVGNSLIIHLVRTRKSIRKNQFYWLIVNTAVADLVDVIAASADSTLLFGFADQPNLGVFGTVLCKGLLYLLVVSICAAIWTLTVIAVDRYLVIVCLRRRALSSRSVLRSIITVWLCAALVSSVYLYQRKTEVDEDGTVQYCYEEWHEDEEINNAFYKAEVIFIVLLTYAVPLVVMAILYFLIARFLWTHKPPVSVNQHAYINQEKKRKTAIKMLITVVTVFAVCWFPVHVSMIMRVFHPYEYLDIPQVLRWLFYWLAHANAAIHPWLFIAFGEHLRRGTREIYRHLRNKLRLRTRSTPNPGTNDDPLPACPGVSPQKSTVVLLNKMPEGAARWTP